MAVSGSSQSPKPTPMEVGHSVREIIASKGRVATSRSEARAWIADSPTIQKLTEYCYAKMDDIDELADQMADLGDSIRHAYHMRRSDHVMASKMRPVMAELMFSGKLMGNFRNLARKDVLSSQADVNRVRELRVELNQSPQSKRVTITPTIHGEEKNKAKQATVMDYKSATKQLNDYVASVQQTARLTEGAKAGTTVSELNKLMENVQSRMNELGEEMRQLKNAGEDTSSLEREYTGLKAAYTYANAAKKKIIDMHNKTTSLLREFQSMNQELENSVPLSSHDTPNSNNNGLSLGISIDVTQKLLQGGSPEEIVASYQEGAGTAAVANQALYSMLPSVSSDQINGFFTTDLPEGTHNTPAISALINELEEKAADDASLDDLKNIANAFIEKRVLDQDIAYDGTTKSADVEWAIASYLTKMGHKNNPKVPIDQIIKSLPIDSKMKGALLQHLAVTSQNQMRELVEGYRGLEQVDVSPEMQAAMTKHSDEEVFAALTSLSAGTYQVRFQTGDTIHDITIHKPSDSEDGPVYIIDPNGLPLKCDNVEDAKATLKKLVNFYNEDGGTLPNHELQFVKYALASQKPEDLEKPSKSDVQQAIRDILERKDKKAESYDQAVEWIRDDPTLAKLDKYCRAKVANLELQAQRALEEGNLEGHKFYKGLISHARYSKLRPVIAQLVFSKQLMGNFRNITTKEIFTAKADLIAAKKLVSEFQTNKLEIVKQMFPLDAEILDELDEKALRNSIYIDNCQQNVLKALGLPKPASGQSMGSIINNGLKEKRQRLNELKRQILNLKNEHSKKESLNTALQEYRKLDSQLGEATGYIKEVNRANKELQEIRESIEITQNQLLNRVVEKKGEVKYRDTGGICLGISIDVSKKLLLGGSIEEISMSYEKGAGTEAAANQSLNSKIVVGLPQDLDELDDFLLNNLPESDYDSDVCQEILDELENDPPSDLSFEELKKTAKSHAERMAKDSDEEYDGSTMNNDIEFAVACFLLKKELKANPDTIALHQLTPLCENLKISDNLKEKFKKQITSNYRSILEKCTPFLRGMQEGRLSPKMQSAVLSNSDSACYDALPSLSPGVYGIDFFLEENSGHRITLHKPSDNNSDPVYIIDPNGFPLKCENMGDAQKTLKKLIMFYHEDDGGLDPDNHKILFTKYELADADK